MKLGVSRRRFLSGGAAATVVTVLSTSGAVAAVKTNAERAKICAGLARQGHAGHQAHLHGSAAVEPAVFRLPATPGNGPERVINLVNTHSQDQLHAVYWSNGRYNQAVLHRLNQLMRDNLSNTVHAIDPRLIDLLADLHRAMGTAEPFQLISGYRSPRTNAWMHRTQPGVACNSFHVKGQAADIELAGADIATLHNAALELARGGVGYYPRSGFVHVDTGSCRQWEFGA